ncbi:hypothetical protein [Roseovarius sp. SCSIO 43702]|nr:hypothetical protein [Roseovarius sp. SCSIO 43702]
MAQSLQRPADPKPVRPQPAKPALPRKPQVISRQVFTDFASI